MQSLFVFDMFFNFLLSLTIFYRILVQDIEMKKKCIILGHMSLKNKWLKKNVGHSSVAVHFLKQVYCYYISKLLRLHSKSKIEECDMS